MTASRTLIAIAALVTAAGAAQAGSHHATVTGPNGASATRSVERSDGQVTDTTTGPNGNSRVREVSRTASGTTATVTGANGATSSRVTERSASGSTTSSCLANSPMLPGISGESRSAPISIFTAQKTPPVRCMAPSGATSAAGRA